MRKGIDHPVRPIPARMLKSLADSLRSELPQSRVLDLFAGHGTMGLRLFEEGAQAVTLVEKDATALRRIRSQVDEGRDGIEIRGDDVFHFLRDHSGPPFEIILADPPFPLWDEVDFADRLYAALRPHLAPSGCLVLKFPAHRLPPQMIYDLRSVKSSQVGDSQLVYYRR